MKIFGFAGYSGSGKTTLIEQLIPRFVARGLRVSLIKHAHHAFDIDQPGKDSHRHREAGATEILLTSSNRWALMHELRGEDEPTLEMVLGRLAPCDLVLVEGYKRENHSKIETRRTGARDSTPLSASDPTIMAIAADHAVVDTTLPVFGLDDIGTIADFIEKATGLSRR